MPRRLPRGEQGFSDTHSSAALCQVFDSIFCKSHRPGMIPADSNQRADDVPMSRVKFNANTEYAYLQNFKILQSTSLLQPGAQPKPAVWYLVTRHEY
jgi:hypothetical protein